MPARARALPTQTPWEAPDVPPELHRKILDILARHNNVTIATLRPDGYRQATTVGYASDGLTVYFGCAPQSQQAQNSARDPRVSAAIDEDHQNWNETRSGYRWRNSPAQRHRCGGAKVERFSAPSFRKWARSLQTISPADRISRDAERHLGVDYSRALGTAISSPCERIRARARRSGKPRRNSAAGIGCLPARCSSRSARRPRRRRSSAVVEHGAGRRRPPRALCAAP